MNRSWKSNSSPGFVYFNKSDTSDFLAFNDTPPLEHSSPKYDHKFSPRNHSSPKFYKSPNKFNLRNTYRYGGDNRNRSFNRSGSWGFESKHYNSQPNDERKKEFKQRIISKSGRDISAFIDHSCVHNPWQELEREMEKETEKKTIKAKEQNENEKVSSSSEYTSDNSGSSGSSSSEEETT